MLLLATLCTAATALAVRFQSSDLYYNTTSDSTVEVAYQSKSSENHQGLTTATISETAPATLTGALTPKPTDPYADDIALTKEYEWFQDSSTGKYGYKHNGRVVIPAKYDDALSFSEGLASVKINGKWGFIDKTDTMVIPAKYDYAEDFSDGKAFVKLNGRWFYIDRNGNEVQ